MGGVWAPKKIPNPDFFEDSEPLKNIGLIKAVALEVWSMNDGVVFDNVLLGNSAEDAASYALKTWAIKKAEASADSDELAEPMNFLPKLLEQEFMQPIVPFVQPLLEQGIAEYGANPVHAAFIVVSVLPLLFLLFCCCCGNSKKIEDQVAKAKKEDITEEDDKPAESESVQPESSKKDDGDDADSKEEEEEEEVVKPTKRKA